MSELNIIGFRRLRTSSQLTFESIPQILWQVRVLLWMRANDDQVDDLDVTENAILISLACAMIHGLIEMLYFWIESKACKTTYLHYILICFNGRFGWVPYLHKFENAQSIATEKEST